VEILGSVRVDRIKELVTYVARQLVDEPDSVRVEVEETDRELVCELTVAQEDLGKVIGKDGKTARAIRTLLAACSPRVRKRVVLEILE
jgi:predicted RNA-binding protein YlqC (UPF0109 family)